ncbi:MAG: hypothetical protein ABI851_12965 [Saprospiraceae bacterium]
MKLLTFSAIIFILFTSCTHNGNDDIKTSCVQNEEISSDYSKYYIYFPGTEKNGYAKAIKINKDWRASAKAEFVNGHLGITLSTFLVENDDNLEAEYLFINLINPVEKCYEALNDELELYAKVSLFAVDDDVTENVYDVNLSVKNNKVQLDTFDLLNKRVAGKFMVSFKKNERSLGGPWYNPDNLRIFNGEFHCNIVD